MRSLLLTLTTCLLVLPAQAKYSGGSGTAQDPYQIATAADLIVLGETPADYGKHFLLTADIDLDPKLPDRKVFDKAVIAPVTSFDTRGSPVGTLFAGIFDGNGHTISHLTISGRDYVGLFGQLASGAVVNNVGLVDVNINAVGSRVGGLAGGSSGSVTQSYSTGAVSGTGWGVGGLVADNYGEVTQCYSTGAVRGAADCVGGLVGRNASTMNQCYSTGAVSGTRQHSSVGGLAGYNQDSVTQCYSTGAVGGTGQHASAGGLVGFNGGTVTLCYSTGAVSGIGQDSSVGGFVGYNYDYGTVANCYSTGVVGGTGYIGGLAGQSYGTMTQCYSSGAVSGNSQVGGLVGNSSNDIGGSVTGCFWDTQTSGQTRSGAGTGKNTGQMQDPNTFRAAGWDFVGQADGPSEIWAMPEGGGYPILWWQLSPLPNLPKFSGGTGQHDAPYVIATAEDLGSIGHNPRLMQCHFMLAADIDLTGIRFSPIGVAYYPYGGVFDGRGYRISHLTIQGDECLGLFGRIDEGEVKDLGVVDVNITGSIWVGGLAGYNWSGTVTECYSTGVVSSTGDYSGAGGLVGANVLGAVTNCHSACTVSGRYGVGGLVGSNGGRLVGSYSIGAVNGGGGLVGADGVGIPGGILGAKGTAIGSAWDTQTSGQAKSAGGTGKTTVEMQTAKTFLDAGWDFVGENKNGTEDIWWIDEGKDYPRLWWELLTGDAQQEADSVTVSVIDDFESYTDANGQRIYQTWIDGYGPDVNVPGNGTCSMVGNSLPPFAERKIVHAGKQSMPMDYNNVKQPWYSEGERTWATPQDWTAEGVDTLTLYFRGKVYNGRDPLYVGIEDSAGHIALVVHPDAEAVRATEWQRWHIALGELRAAGVDVAAVQKMVIGVGDRKNPKPGGTGRIYIDDIRLTKRMP